MRGFLTLLVLVAIAGGIFALGSFRRGEDDKPMLYVFSSCINLIRTLPALQHDTHRAEDVDTAAEDHAADALRYACMTRPYVRDRPLTDEEKRAEWQKKRGRGRYTGRRHSTASAWAA